MYGYVKIGSISCHIVSNASLFLYKTRISTISMACPCHIHAQYPGIIHWEMVKTNKDLKVSP